MRFRHNSDMADATYASESLGWVTTSPFILLSLSLLWLIAFRPSASQALLEPNALRC